MNRPFVWVALWPWVALCKLALLLANYLTCLAFRQLLPTCCAITTTVTGEWTVKVQRLAEIKSYVCLGHKQKAMISVLLWWWILRFHSSSERSLEGTRQRHYLFLFFHSILPGCFCPWFHGRKSRNLTPSSVVLYAVHIQKPPCTTAIRILIFSFDLNMLLIQRRERPLSAKWTN